MPSQIDILIKTIKDLDDRLEAEFARHRAELKVGLEKGRVVFEAEVLRRHRAAKIGLWDFLRRARFQTVITAPIIYAMILPFALLDLFVSLYQAICFPVYGITKVCRADYLVFDRHYLAYLNALQKLNCAYCAYATGVIGYVREVAARTGKYWCPIKHARRVISAHGHYADFSDYGDADAFLADLDRLRADLAAHSHKSQKPKPD